MTRTIFGMRSFHAEIEFMLKTLLAISAEAFGAHQLQRIDISPSSLTRCTVPLPPSPSNP